MVPLLTITLQHVAHEIVNIEISHKILFLLILLYQHTWIMCNAVFFFHLIYSRLLFLSPPSILHHVTSICQCHNCWLKIGGGIGAKMICYFYFNIFSSSFVESPRSGVMDRYQINRFFFTMESFMDKEKDEKKKKNKKQPKIKQKYTHLEWGE